MSNLEERNQVLEKEKARLLRKINTLEEERRISFLSHVDTADQFVEGRQHLYDRLEECLEEGGEHMQSEIDHIISQLRIRTGQFGYERKNLINNLFKSIIDLSFPNIVKWLFLQVDKPTNGGSIFEPIDEEQYKRNKRMSKYKKDEIQQIWKQHNEQINREHLQEDDEKADGEVRNMHTINSILDISVEQNHLLIKEQANIRCIKQRYQEHIDNLLKCKKGLFKESRNMEESISTLRSILASEQTAKLLIMMEKYRPTDFSIFNIWNIKQLDKEQIKKQTQIEEDLQNQVQQMLKANSIEQHCQQRHQRLSLDTIPEGQEDKEMKKHEEEEDFDMALPNDENDDLLRSKLKQKGLKENKSFTSS